MFEDTHLATADECGMNADKPEEYTCDHFAIGKQTVMKNAMMERADDYKIDTDIQASICCSFSIFFIGFWYMFHFRNVPVKVNSSF